MTPAATCPIRLTVSAAISAEFDTEPLYEIVRFDDGTLRATGLMPPGDRDATTRTHVKGGLDAEGRVSWYAKEADDDV